MWSIHLTPFKYVAYLLATVKIEKSVAGNTEKGNMAYEKLLHGKVLISCIVEGGNHKN